MANRYALRDHDDRIDGSGTTWWLYLADLGAGVPHVHDVPLEAAEARGWWRVPAGVDFDPATTEVYVVLPPREETVGYQLTIQTPDFPARLTVEDWRERTDDESERYDRRVASLYTPILYTPIREKRDPVEGGWFVLDGAPPPDGARAWVAKLPHVLAQQRQYLHLFPGHLEGFREALATALGEIPGCSAYAKTRGVEAYLSVEVPKKPKTLFDKVAVPSRPRSRRDRERAQAAEASSTTRITRHLEIPAPYTIEAQNYAAGRALWESEIARVVEAVRVYAATACPTCGGHGWVEEGAP